METQQRKPPSSWRTYLMILGPGIAIAATGVGAGDMVAATVSGANYGFAIVWAAAVGALLKFMLNEGLARWQLATGTTLLEGWVQKLGRWVQYYFLIYLVLWSFLVGGALISACGMAAHAIAPGLSVEVWGIIHSLGAMAVVLLARYKNFERLMKIFIGVMFITLIGCALWISPPLPTLKEIATQASIPPGSPKFILSVIGGVGGTLTLLAYGYWMRERVWKGPQWTKAVRLDLSVAYILTGIFGIALMALASRVLHVKGVTIAGSKGVIQMAGMLSDTIGPVGHWTFLIGFWGAITTSMLGVWQSVPYMFCDFVGLMRKLPAEEHKEMLNSRSPWYRGYLLWLAIPPMTLLFFKKPVGLVMMYSVIGALFMPFLAGTLLYMNSRRDWVGDEHRNGWLTIVLLVMALILFGYLCANQLIGVLGNL